MAPSSTLADLLANAAAVGVEKENERLRSEDTAAGSPAAKPSDAEPKAQP